nr:putative capsid [Marmot picobirnavirus]
MSQTKKNYRNRDRKPRTTSNTRRQNNKAVGRANVNDVDNSAATSASQAMSRDNDITWYSKFPQFLQDAGRLSFSWPLGIRPTFENNDSIAVGGIMRLCFYPGVGYSEDMNSPINRSAVRFYTFLRSIQKSAATYDSADLMMYLMAMDACYMFHANMRRAYEVAQLFTPLNTFYPRNLLQYMGFDPSIMDNLAEFRAYINRFGLQLGMYTVPTDFAITNRHMWMCEGLYTDSSSTRAQTYVFVPEGFWSYNNTVATGSQLDFIPWLDQQENGNTLHTLEQVIEMGNNLISHLRNDEDTGKISGDLYVAYKGNTRKVTELHDLDVILPSYSEEVLSQIENATVCGLYSPGYTPVISQDPSVNNGAIIYKPVFGAIDFGNKEGNGWRCPGVFAYTGRMMNMHVDSPNPEQVIEASRLMVISRPGLQTSKNTLGWHPTSFGADVISRFQIAVRSENGTGVSNLQVLSSNLYYSSGSGGPYYKDQMILLALLRQFSRGPMMYLASWTPIPDDDQETAMSKLDIQYVGNDVDNMTYVSGNQLEMMHEATLLSLFDVPQMGI